MGVLCDIGKGRIALPTLGLGSAIGDIRDDDFVVITARGGTGKTWLMLNMAVDLANQGTPVAFFSGEMSLTDLAETRLVRMFHETRSMMEKLPSERLNEMEKIKAIPLFFPAIESRWQFRTVCVPIMDKIRKENGIKAFFFDHLRFFYNADPASFRNDERLTIEQTVMDMRLYAKQNKTPIILAVQPRQIHSDEETTIDALKGSSAISQDATNVIVLDRPRKKKTKDRNAGEKPDGLGEDEVFEPYTLLKVEKARHAAGNARFKIFLDYANGRLIEWEKGGSDLYSKIKTFGLRS